MGTDAHLIVDSPGAAELAAEARRHLEDLEDRWSRFRPTSELSQLNAAGGAPVVVTGATYSLIERAIDAAFATGGRFNPAVLHAVVAAGYDQSFELLNSGPRPTPEAAVPVGSCADVMLIPDALAVCLPPGVGLDLGGIGKGYAADLVVADLLAAGAVGVCVNLGGDLRVGGRAPSPAGWIVSVDDPFTPGAERVRLALSEGAVATSARTRRRWDSGHHLIDPDTGRPADSGIAQVTVIAAAAVDAEVLAKAAFLAGPVDGPDLVQSWGASALFVTDTGGLVAAGSIKEHLR